jgi:hypothetical protein
MNSMHSPDKKSTLDEKLFIEKDNIITNLKN